ncbi:hypothetical protein D9M68_897590 [compost metagenome]
MPCRSVGTARAVGQVFKGFHRHPAVVVQVFQHLQHRALVGIALSGAAPILVVHLNVGDVAAGEEAAQHLVQRFAFTVRRGAHIEHGADRGRADAVHQRGRFGHGVDHVRLERPERFDAIDDAGRGRVRRQFGQRGFQPRGGLQHALAWCRGALPG